jgi:UDP-glucose 4-epimerase
MADFLVEQVPINPYGKAKKMSEDLIKDFARTADLSVMILRYRAGPSRRIASCSCSGNCLLHHAKHVCKRFSHSIVPERSLH